MDKTQQYIKENQQRFVDELFEFLRIPSISADPSYKADVQKAAEFVKEKLLEAGVDTAEIIPTNGHPIVYGEKLIDPSLPTIMVYGHYDVQPPDPLDLWNSPPFEPTIKTTVKHPNGAIFARGACDDKGQLFMHVKAFEAMHSTGLHKCNIKFMIEGEEEVGSEHLAEFLESNTEKLACDVILISDTSMYANDLPSITVGLRGLAYLEVTVHGPNRDLHSGVYGGAVGNPANILAQMISRLKDENNRITIPGFYDKVIELSPEERKEMARIPFDMETYCKEIGIPQSEGEKGYSPMEQTSIRPTLDVNGIWGGYTGDGAKTVLPSKASAKISMRLVPDQDPDEITELFSAYFKSLAPAAVRVDVTNLHGGQPAVTPTDTPEYLAASKAMEKTFGKKPVPLRSGGSIPIVALFEQVLGVKSVLMGFGLDSDALHSPNEHFGLFNFYKGIETIPYYHEYYAELRK